MGDKSFMERQQERAVLAMMSVCAAQADQWAERTKLADLVNRMTTDEDTRRVLMNYGKQCFAEGLFHGTVSLEGANDD